MLLPSCLSSAMVCVYMGCEKVHVEECKNGKELDGVDDSKV